MNSTPLAGWRVLVTRPAHQAEPLGQRLRAVGAQCCNMPLLEIQPFTEEDLQAGPLRSCFLDLDHYRTLIFVSANAARLAWEWIDRYWPQLPVGIQWLAVGQATAETLNHQGVPAQTPETGMDTEALLACPELQAPAGERILICRGTGGREALAEKLRARGARVDYAELYQRRCPSYTFEEVESRIYTPPASAILISSGEALLNLITLKGARPLPSGLLVVPGRRVARLAQEAGFHRIIVADNATDDAMLAALSEAATNNE